MEKEFLKYDQDSMIICSIQTASANVNYSLLGEIIETQRYY